MQSELLTVEATAEMLSLGRSKTYELIARGVIPVIRVGRSTRVPRAAVLAWIEAQLPPSWAPRSLVTDGSGHAGA